MGGKLKARKMRNTGSRGFTLVELLVVIAIIGVLVGLLLPAVQAAREAARRMSCSNNMKQIGLALHNYESTHRTFPSSWIVTTPTGTVGPGLNMTVWGLMLLPFMEQQPLYDRYDPRVPAFNEAAGIGYPPAVVLQNISVVSTVVPTYLCPSVPGAGASRVYDWDYNPDFPVTGRAAPSDYCAVSGVRGAYASIAFANFPGGSRHGALQFGGDNVPGVGTPRRSRMSDILDGTSNTILIGERTGGNAIYVGRLQRAVTPYDLLGRANGGGWGDILNGEHWPAGSIRNETAPLEGPCAINCTNRRGAGFHSFHPGGAMFLMADGSVQFISDSVDAFRFAAGITRAGGEAVSLNE